MLLQSDVQPPNAGMMIVPMLVALVVIVILIAALWNARDETHRRRLTVRYRTLRARMGEFRNVRYAARSRT